ncbi:MAG: peptidoglycan-binding protein [Alphaproteobacteria bacterium]
MKPVMDWTVRGMDEAARRRAEAAAEAAGLPLAAWLDRAILENAASHVPPSVWAGRESAPPDQDDDGDAAAADAADDADATPSLADPRTQDEIRQALDRLDARLERSSRAIAGAVVPMTRKLDALAGQAAAAPAASPAPQGPMLPAIYVTRPDRAYRRGLGLIAAALLLLSFAGAGGLAWVWFDMQEPPPNPYAEMDDSELPPIARPAVPSRAPTPTPAAAARSGAPPEHADLERLIEQGRDDAAGDPPAADAAQIAAPQISAQQIPAPQISEGDAPLDGDAKLIAQLRAAAAQNDAKAQHDLALLLMEGRLLPRDEAAAGELFEQAAMQGLANAQYNLGVIYDAGLGRAADPTMAYFWYSAAADQGHVPAQYNLGVAAAQGKGAPRDYAVAALWFERAARSGLPDAQYNLGQMHESGIGVPRDADKAYELYAAAAAQGHTPARQRMIGLASQLAARGATLPAVPSAASPPPSRAPVTSAATRPVSPALTRPASPALTREDIVEVQTLLRKLELLKGAADGMIGPGTRAAIRQYQAMAGLAQTGEPSRELLTELREVGRP